MKTIITSSAVAAALGLAVAAAVPAPASAQLARPMAAQAVAGDAATVTQVQWRGRHHRGHRWHGHRHGRWIGPGIGFGAGLALGSALATPYYYAPPAVVYAEPSPSANEVAYCSQRFRSYDPASGTYLGYDGERHPCP
jgi:hypothetical protein